MYQNIEKEAAMAVEELLRTANVMPGGVIVVGCSTSEIAGINIGKGSSPDIAAAVLRGITPILEQTELYLAAQCCEHLNRALIIERDVAHKYGYEIVTVRPRPKAGGSFASAAYEYMRDPVAVEFIKVDAGIDIGCTLIGMHIKHVAIPVRLQQNRIGEAIVTAAKSRPKLIGGARAEYPD